jgi:hypothetical protein
MMQARGWSFRLFLDGQEAPSCCFCAIAAESCRAVILELQREDYFLLQRTNEKPSLCSCIRQRHKLQQQERRIVSRTRPQRKPRPMLTTRVCLRMCCPIG